MREDGTTPVQSNLLTILVTIGEMADKHDFSGDVGIESSELLEDFIFMTMADKAVGVTSTRMLRDGPV